MKVKNTKGLCWLLLLSKTVTGRIVSFNLVLFQHHLTASYTDISLCHFTLFLWFRERAKRIIRYIYIYIYIYILRNMHGTCNLGVKDFLSLIWYIIDLGSLQHEWHVNTIQWDFTIHLLSVYQLGKCFEMNTSWIFPFIWAFVARHVN